MHRTVFIARLVTLRTRVRISTGWFLRGEGARLTTECDGKVVSLPFEHFTVDLVLRKIASPEIIARRKIGRETTTGGRESN